MTFASFLLNTLGNTPLGIVPKLAYQTYDYLMPNVVYPQVQNINYQAALANQVTESFKPTSPAVQEVITRNEAPTTSGSGILSSSTQGFLTGVSTTTIIIGGILLFMLLKKK